MSLAFVLLLALLLNIVSALPLAQRATGVVFEKGVGNDPGNIHDGIGAGVDAYNLYLGDGSNATGWPTKEQWVSFEEMFNANKVNMRVSCSNNGWGENDSEEEIAQIWNAIQSAAYQTQVDHRFILAVMMQESQGCVRVHTTDNGVVNPGLMQSHNGQFSCNDARGVQSPCPDFQIFGMIAEGAQNTASGDGLASILNNVASCNDAQQYYKASRQYNTGSIPDPWKLESKGASTACYVSDIANRLMGWVTAPTGCHFT